MSDGCHTPTCRRKSTARRLTAVGAAPLDPEGLGIGLPRLSKHELPPAVFPPAPRLVDRYHNSRKYSARVDIGLEKYHALYFRTEWTYGFNRFMEGARDKPAAIAAVEVDRTTQ